MGLTGYSTHLVYRREKKETKCIGYTYPAYLPTMFERFENEPISVRAFRRMSQSVAWIGEEASFYFYLFEGFCFRFLFSSGILCNISFLMNIWHFIAPPQVSPREESHNLSGVCSRKEVSGSSDKLVFRICVFLFLLNASLTYPYIT